MNLRNKSIVFVGIIIILSFVAVAYLIGEKMAVTARKMSVDLAVSKAQNSFLIVKDELEESILKTEMLARSVEESLDANGNEEKAIGRVLCSALNYRKELDACWYLTLVNSSLGNQTSALCARNGLDGIEKLKLSEDRYQMFQKMIALGKEIISAPYQNEENVLLVTVLIPVMQKGKIVGAVGADLNLYRFQEHFYDNESLGRAYVTIITNQGICITHPDEGLIGKRMDTLADGDQIRRALVFGKKYQDEVHSEYLQVPVIRVYQPIKIGSSEKNWLVTVSVPLFNVKESVQEIRNSTLLIGLVLAFMLMVFLYFSQRKWLYEYSQRQKAEKKHQNEVHKLSSILESTDQIMIFSVDRNYKYTSFNSVHQNDIQKQEDVNIKVGNNLLESYCGDFRIQMKNHLDRALAGDHFLVEFQRHGIYYQQIFNAIFDADGTVVGVSSFRFDISETIQLRRRAREEEEEKVKAQLKNITNQINPHFLFNSLNSLYALVEDEPALARKFIVNLSKVYRYLLDRNNSNLISLKQEMEFLTHYLFLQKIRFGENLQLEYQIEKEIFNRKLPSVSLQSLVENAIKHNVITSDNPLIIRISVTDTDWLLIENPYQPRNEMSNSSGTGLKTLEALYEFLGDRQPVYGIVNDVFRVKLPLL